MDVRYSAAETITTPLLRHSLVALPALRNCDVWAAIKADKLDRLKTWINVSAALSYPFTRIAELACVCLLLRHSTYIIRVMLRIILYTQPGTYKRPASRVAFLADRCCLLLCCPVYVTSILTKATAAQATLARPSNKSTGPSDEEIVENWKTVATPLED